jgi:Sigma-54 interaction domain/Bacterial regulatory protein, Fis family
LDEVEIMRADPSTALLHTISEVLDIRAVFPRVSEIANHVLPHDWLGLVFHDHSDRVTLQAGSAESFPEFRRLAVAGEGEDQVVSDIEKERLRMVQSDPPDLVDRILEEGYRSFLKVRGVAGEQVLGLSATHRSPSGTVIGQSSAWARRLEKGVASGSDRNHHVTAGRVGHGQGGRCAVYPPGLSEEKRTVRGAQLRGPSRDAPRVRAVRVRAGRVHRRERRKTRTDRAGRGGVLFLDEMSEMSPSAQAKFLRVLQEREFLRLGGTRPVKANVRVIAATNRDLCEAVEEGAFREDLFYRLDVFGIQLPALRERRADIPLLAAAFLDDIGRSLGRPPAELTRDAKDVLLAHDWPGNVRELRNALERAAILCDGGLIAREHLLLHPRPAAPSVTNDLQTVERRRIEQVLRETDGNKSRAASRLGLTRTQLYVRLRKYDLARPAIS